MLVLLSLFKMNDVVSDSLPQQCSNVVSDQINRFNFMTHRPRVCRHKHCKDLKITRLGEFNTQTSLPTDNGFDGKKLIEQVAVYPRPQVISTGQFDCDEDDWRKLVWLIKDSLKCLRLFVNSVTPQMLTALLESTQNLLHIELYGYFDVDKLKALTKIPSTVNELWLATESDQFAEAVVGAGVDILNNQMFVLGLRLVDVCTLNKLQKRCVRVDQLLNLELANCYYIGLPAPVSLDKLTDLTIESQDVVSTMENLEMPTLKRLKLLVKKSDNFLTRHFQRLSRLKIFNSLIKTLVVESESNCSFSAVRSSISCRRDDQQRVCQCLEEMRQRNARLEWSFDLLVSEEEAKRWQLALKRDEFRRLNADVDWKHDKFKFTLDYAVHVEADDSKCGRMVIKTKAETG